MKKNIEWLLGDEKESAYHLEQYDKPKEYSKYLLKKFIEWELDKESNCILDLGCGAGAVTYSFAKANPNINFVGIDINPKYIAYANDHKIANTSFEVKDFKEISNANGNFEGILCLQTLSWINSYDKMINTMINLNPKWILITSLYYDGPVDAKIKIIDFSRSMGNHNFRSSYYNIYSIDRLEQKVNKKGYRIINKEPFIFPYDLSKPQNSSMGTYTEKLLSEQRIQISGPILMSWYTLLIKKK